MKTLYVLIFYITTPPSGSESNTSEMNLGNELQVVFTKPTVLLHRLPVLQINLLFLMLYFGNDNL
jgi:hypothetical protein